MKKMTDTFKLNNGYEIPCVGFGTWQTPDGDTAIKAVSEAIRAGYGGLLWKRNQCWKRD